MLTVLGIGIIKCLPVILPTIMTTVPTTFPVVEPWLVSILGAPFGL